jgi:hypothetical protein
MKSEALLSRLLAAARLHPPDESVPYAFEKRIMARLSRPLGVEASAWWNRLLWRAAVPCVGLMFMASVWTFMASNGTAANEELAAELESAVFAPVDTLEVAW